MRSVIVVVIVVLGVLIALAGLLFALQGFGALSGSPMSNRDRVHRMARAQALGILG